MGRDPLEEESAPLDEERAPLDTGGTSIVSNVSTPLILNEEKLDMTDLPGQQSVGDLVVSCRVLL